jgi:hypothetical protein
MRGGAIAPVTWILIDVVIEENTVAERKKSGKKKLRSRSSSRTRHEPDMSLVEIVEIENTESVGLKAEAEDPQVSTNEHNTEFYTKNGKKVRFVLAEMKPMLVAGDPQTVDSRTGTRSSQQLPNSLRLSTTRNVDTVTTDVKPQRRRKLRSRSSSRTRNETDDVVLSTDVNVQNCDEQPPTTADWENEADTSFTRKTGRVSLRKRKTHRLHDASDTGVDSTMDISRDFARDLPPQLPTDEMPPPYSPTDVGESVRTKPPISKKPPRPRFSSGSQGHHADEDGEHSADVMAEHRLLHVADQLDVEQPHGNNDHDASFSRRKGRVSRRKHGDATATENAAGDRPSDVTQEISDADLSIVNDASAVEDVGGKVTTRQTGRRRLRSRSSSRTRNENEAEVPLETSTANLQGVRSHEDHDINADDPSAALGAEATVVSAGNHNSTRKPRKRLVRSRSNSRSRSEFPATTDAGHVPDDGDNTGGDGAGDVELEPERFDVTDASAKELARRRRSKKKLLSSSRQETSFDDELTNVIQSPTNAVSAAHYEEIVEPVVAVAGESNTKKNKRKKKHVNDNDDVIQAEADDGCIVESTNDAGDAIQYGIENVLTNSKKRKQKKDSRSEFEQAVDEQEVDQDFTADYETQDPLEHEAHVVDSAGRTSKRTSHTKKSKSNFNNNNLSKDTSVDEVTGDLLHMTCDQPLLKAYKAAVPSIKEQHHVQRNTRDAVFGETSKTTSKTRRSREKTTESRIAVEMASAEDAPDGTPVDKTLSLSGDLDSCSFHPVEADLGSDTPVPESTADVATVIIPRCRRLLNWRRKLSIKLTRHIHLAPSRPFNRMLVVTLRTPLLRM